MTNLLQEIVLLEKQATSNGFAWPNVDMILDQVTNECKEVQQAIAENESPARIQEEIGDILHAAISLCVFMNFDVEETLTNSKNKFEKRFLTVLDIAREQGYADLKNQPIEKLLTLWDLAKQRQG
jgi:uncharacterized protein YabN with tetrapyrrole methylase and pyrophosphatase domain